MTFAQFFSPSVGTVRYTLATPLYHTLLAHDENTITFFKFLRRNLDI
jgi:hypothetical protein